MNEQAVQTAHSVPHRACVRRLASESFRVISLLGTSVAVKNGICNVSAVYRHALLGMRTSCATLVFLTEFAPEDIVRVTIPVCAI